MISELITDQLNISTTDAIAVSALFLVAIISLRAFKLMQIGSEFDNQLKKHGSSISQNSDQYNAWKKEYIANRLGGYKRYNKQRKQKAAFYSSRPVQKANYSKPQTKPIQKNQLKLKSVKTKYGISNKKSLYGQRLDKYGNRHFMQPARPYQQRELNSNREPLTYSKFKSSIK